jgi:hypothetical protein
LRNGKLALETVKTLTEPSGKQRVRIILRDDGMFVLKPERWSEEYWEGKLIWKGWAPIGRSPSFFASLEIAEREALAEYKWLVAQP